MSNSSSRVYPNKGFVFRVSIPDLVSQDTFSGKALLPKQRNTYEFFCWSLDPLETFVEACDVFMSDVKMADSAPLVVSFSRSHADVRFDPNLEGLKVVQTAEAPWMRVSEREASDELDLMLNSAFSSEIQNFFANVTEYFMEVALKASRGPDTKED